MWLRLVFLGIGSLAMGIGLGHLRTLPPPPAALPTRLVTPSPAALTTNERPRWRRLWIKPFPALRRVSLAPDGNVACLRNDDTVTLLRGADGTVAWTSPPLPLARGLVAVRGGRVLAYPLRNPVLFSLWILNGSRGRPSTFTANGSLWCVVATPDGESAFIGTGKNTVQKVALTPQLPTQQWQLGGRPESIAVSTDGSDVVIGTWLLSGVRRLESWTYTESDPTRWHEMFVSADGATTVALSGRGPHHRYHELRLTAYDSESGLRLWEKPLQGTDPKVALSADGQRVAVSYSLETSHGATRSREHRLQSFNRNGSPLFEEKGGRFLDPRLVAISALGERITVLDGDRALLVLDGQGRTRWRLPFERPQPIIETLSTPDGTYLLLHSSDNTLTLYQATN